MTVTLKAMEKDDQFVSWLLLYTTHTSQLGSIDWETMEDKLNTAIEYNAVCISLVDFNSFSW